jgi:DNA-binding LacI/PurR family transcriptional regulator
MSDVARLAGVSQTTVSFIVNDTPGNTIPLETRERVAAAIRELGYRPNVSARNLRTQSSNLIGYGVEDPLGVASHPVLDRFLYSTIRSMEAAGYHVLTFVTKSRTETVTYQELYRRGQVAGFVLANTNDNDVRIATLMEAGIPFASFGRSNDAWDFPWVDVDNVDGLEQVTDHLLATGHRRMGLITWPEGSKAGNHREVGYANGLAKAGVSPDPAWLFRGENSFETGAAGIAHFLSLPEDRRPTAVACVSDLIATGAMNAVATAGLRVGHDIAITGYDDSAMAKFLHPPLTSVRQPITQVGQEVARLLMAQIGGDPVSTNQVLLKPTLVRRESSGTRQEDINDGRGSNE